MGTPMYAKIKTTKWDQSPFFKVGQTYPVFKMEKICGQRFFETIDDTDRIAMCCVNNCSYLGGGSWELLHGSPE